jgi:hypothetical protein
VSNLEKILYLCEHCEDTGGANYATFFLCSHPVVLDWIREEDNREVLGRFEKAITKVHARANKWLFTGQ